MSSEESPSKPRVLVVDDSRVIRVAARKILKDEFDTLEAGDGEEAWELLAAHEDIALVISDLSMPYLDGMGLLQRLRAAESEQLRSLPMIIVTGAEDDDGAKTRAFAAGATDFISKPFDSVQLLAHTRSHIRLQKTAVELKQAAATLNEKPATDPFTGLGNAHAFQQNGRQALAHALRHRTEFTLLLFQVDGFDDLFVRQGKAVGGAVLKAVTAALQAEGRREDMTARLSMARFGLVMPSTNTVGARHLVQRITAHLAGMPVEGRDGSFTVTLSAGILTPTVQPSTRFEDLFAELAVRLDRALQQGGAILDTAAPPAPAAPPPAKAVPAQDRPSAPTPPATPVITNTAGDAAQIPEPAAAGHPEAIDAHAAAESAPDIEAALTLLQRGEHALLEPHLGTLVLRLLPLLEQWNAAEQRGLADALARIRAALATTAPPETA